MENQQDNNLAKLLITLMPLYHQKISSVLSTQHENGILLGKNQRRTLFILHIRGAMLPSRLGTLLEMKKGSLTTLIDSLIKMDLVKRSRDIKDRRKTWISLTENGKEKTGTHFKQVEIALLKVFDTTFTIEEQKSFRESLHTVITMLKKI